MSETMTDSFHIDELVEIFRAGLLAILPVMERARLPWIKDGSSDPWDRVQEGLYDAILGSCIEHIVAPDKVQPLAPYGYLLPNYGQHSFLSARSLRLAGKPNAFFDLTDGTSRFDTAVLRNLGQDLFPAEGYSFIALADANFEIAIRNDSIVTYCDVVTYRT